MKFGFIRFSDDIILCIQNKAINVMWILLKGRFIIRKLLSISALLHLTEEKSLKAVTVRECRMN